MEAFIAKHLTCVICQDEYEDPRRLTCQHVFCCKCLEGHIKATAGDRYIRGGTVLIVGFNCPECRKVMQIPRPREPREQWGSQCNKDYKTSNIQADIKAGVFRIVTTHNHGWPSNHDDEHSAHSFEGDITRPKGLMYMSTVNNPPCGDASDTLDLNPEGPTSHLDSTPEGSTPHLDLTPEGSTPHLGLFPAASISHLGFAPEGSTSNLDSTPEGSTPHLDSTPEGSTPHLDSTLGGSTPHLGSTQEGSTPHLDSTPEGSTPYLGSTQEGSTSYVIENAGREAIDGRTGGRTRHCGVTVPNQLSETSRNDGTENINQIPTLQASGEQSGSFRDGHITKGYFENVHINIPTHLQNGLSASDLEIDLCEFSEEDNNPRDTDVDSGDEDTVENEDACSATTEEPCNVNAAALDDDDDDNGDDREDDVAGVHSETCNNQEGCGNVADLRMPYLNFNNCVFNNVHFHHN